MLEKELNLEMIDWRRNRKYLNNRIIKGKHWFFEKAITIEMLLEKKKKKRHAPDKTTKSEKPDKQ